MDHHYAKSAKQTKKLDTQDYGDLPIHRPASAVPNELSLAKRALEDSENRMRQGYLYQPARVEQVNTRNVDDSYA